VSVAPVAPQLGRFVNAEKAVIGLLEDLAPGHIDVETPANLQDLLPFVRVARKGGQSSQLSASPSIDVWVYCERDSRDDAVDLAADCEALLLSFPHSIPGVGIIDRVDSEESPNEVPYANSQIRLFSSSYKVTVRR
jgi:hypothetical protein